MKYMTFNSSCSYCCLANLLEAYGIDVEDRDIALEMGLPYLFSYDREEGAYQSGAMLQGKYWFNRYLKAKGFRFVEKFITKLSAIEYMEAHIPCMIGLKTEFGKHAMIYVWQQDGRHRFLNPHRKEDGQPDEVLLTDHELQKALSEVNAIGWIGIAESPVPMDDADYQLSLTWLHRYKEKLRSFCLKERSNTEIIAAMNSLLRPFAVDGLAMMELAGEAELAKELRLFQQECMALFRAGNCRPAEIVDMNRLDRIVTAYELLITKKLNQ